MTKCVITMLKKEDNGWSYIDTDVVNVTAEANEVWRDVRDHTREHYTDDLDGEQITAMALELGREIEDIDVEATLENEVLTILHDTLDGVQINVSDIDIGVFLNVSISVDQAGLEEELEEGKVDSELTYNAELNMPGIMIYIIRNSSNKVIGKVILTWLEG